MDVVLFDESGKPIYNVQKKQYDSHSFTAQGEGIYKFCFSNEFSTFSHKVVYFDFQSGDEIPLTKDLGAHQTALTQMETACVTIHEDLKVGSVCRIYTVSLLYHNHSCTFICCSFLYIVDSTLLTEGLLSLDFKIFWGKHVYTVLRAWCTLPWWPTFSSQLSAKGFSDSPGY